MIVQLIGLLLFIVFFGAMGWVLKQVWAKRSLKSNRLLIGQLGLTKLVLQKIN